MSRKVYDERKSRKSSLPHVADYHHGIHKIEEDRTFKSYRNHCKHGNNGRENEDELVKYMSSLPGYLQRGSEENREKVMNVGVLDWTRLEQWRYNQRNSRSSTCSSASSSVSTEELSGHASKDQRTLRRSLQSHFTRSVGHFQDVRGSVGNINMPSQHVRVDDCISEKHSNSRLKGCDRKYLSPKEQMHNVASCPKLEMPTRDSVMGKRVVNLKELNIDNGVQSMLRKTEPVVCLMPRDDPRISHYQVPHVQTFLAQKSKNYSRMSFSEQPKEFFRKELNNDASHSGTLPDELGCNDSQHKGSGSSSTDRDSIKLPASTFSSPLKSENYSRMSFSEQPKEFFCKELNCDVSHSGTLPDELGCNDSQHKGSGCSSTDTESIKLPASTFSSPVSTSSSTLSVRAEKNPVKSIKAEEKKQAMAKNSFSNVPLHELDKKETLEKSRSSSPFRRLSISIGYKSRGSAFKETRHVAYQNSTAAAKGSSENVRGCANSNISVSDKHGGTGRTRSSPLRRLLDPLLKPKTAKFSHSLESSQKDSSTYNNCKDLKFDCNPVKTIDSSKDKKHVPSTNQALLRIAVKNGLPLFTFAVDQTDGKILVAKVKNLGGSGKDKCNRIYTFFTFREAKEKKGSWMSKAGKTKGPDYVPHAVAQMKASDLHHCDLTGRNCVDSSIMKEFVLFSVKLGQVDVSQDTDYQPNDELAAIAVKVPKAISLINNQHHNISHNDSQEVVRATVVLPVGVHSLPSKGGPSSLLERWKSGGSCDCGGWDLDCKLKILAGENQASRKPRSSKVYFADYHFGLFVQGNEKDPRPAFSLTSFENGMCSVSFDSSLSLLQAFAICIALVDSKMPCELSGSRNSIKGKSTKETILVQSEELKSYGKLKDIPTSYVSYPPASPVGRV